MFHNMLICHFVGIMIIALFAYVIVIMIVCIGGVILVVVIGYGFVIVADCFIVIIVCFSTIHWLFIIAPPLTPFSTWSLPYYHYYSYYPPPAISLLPFITAQPYMSFISI